jgi:hypothetical protein
MASASPRQISQWMKGREIGIAQAPHLLQSFEREADVAFDRHAHFLGRLELRRDFFRWVLPDRRKQVTIDPPETAIDPLFPRNRFDAVDGGGVAFIKRLRTVKPAQLCQCLKPIVALRRQVGRGARAHAAGNLSSV